MQCDQEGPGSRAQIVEYVQTVLEQNVAGLQPGRCVSSGLPGLANGIVISILHRLGIEDPHAPFVDYEEFE